MIEGIYDVSGKTNHQPKEGEILEPLYQIGVVTNVTNIDGHEDMFKGDVIDSMTFLDNEGEDGEDLKQADVPADFSAVIPLLFELKDGLKDIENRIKESNGEVIQSVVKAVMEQKTPVEDPNTAIMKAIMPELIKNPSALKTLMDISNKEKNQ